MMLSILLAATVPDRWEFIWASYAVFIVVFIILILAPVIWRNQLRKKLNQYYRRKELLKSSEQ